MNKRILRILRTLVMLFGAASLGSCTTHLIPLFSFASFSPKLNQSFQFGTNNAVVFGRFTTGKDFAFGNELALRLHNEDLKTDYLVRFQDKDSMYGIAVKPGHYRVAGWVATFIDHRPVGKCYFTNTPLFEVRTNTVTYVGDFTGYAKLGALAMGQTWNLTGLTNNFTATEVEFRQKNPNLSSALAVSAFNQPPM